MISNRFSDAMGHIDDRLLARYQSYQEKLTKKRRLTFIAAAACLALLVTAALVFPVKTMHFTAQEIGAMFNSATNDGSGTNAYTKIYVPTPEYLDITPIPEDQYLPIYEYREGGKSLQEAELRALTDLVLSNLATDPLPQYTVESREDELYISLEQGGYGLYIRQDPKANYLGLSSAESDSLTLGGLPIQMDQTKSDEQIISDLSAIRQQLFTLFGVSFSDVKIDRYYTSWENGASSLTVYFYNADDHPLNEFSEWPVSDCISLRFSRDRNLGSANEEPIMTDVSIGYYQYREKPAATTATIGRAKRISLTEAEALLEKGYVFAGHTCPICMAEQEAVDFSDYDYVGLEYEWGWDEEGNRTFCIPFYAFFKSIGTADNGYDIYAKTYVPAIEITGLDEYFESQAANHK